MNFLGLKRILNPDILFETIQRYWTDYVKREFEIEPSVFSADTDLLDKMSEDGHKIYAVIDIASFQIDYIGKNVEAVTGYTHEEFMKRGMFRFVQMIPMSQLSFFWNILDWTIVVMRKFPVEKTAQYFSYGICGLKIKQKSGKILPIFIRAYGAQKNERGTFMKVVVEITDITNLIKSEEYWAHFTVGAEKKDTFCFFSDKNLKSSNNLVTPRELEILKLVAIGHSSKEIGEQLSISHSTVEKHRKNMISNVGAIDTFALVEICKRCGII